MRKYLTEHIVNIFSARWLSTTASQLMSGGEMPEDEAEISENCHIYLICKHPAFSYCPDSFRYEGDVLSGNINYRIAGKLFTLPFRFPFPLLDGAVKVELSPYPHRDLLTIDAAGSKVRYVPSNVIALGMKERLASDHIGHFEVLYVGQAYAEGRRSAFERLRSHSTPQKILAQSQHEDPDSEIVVFAFEYAPYRLITQMDGMAKGVESGEVDSQRFMSIVENPLTEHQQICLVEAALIRYFSPKYNEIYKENFPSDSHKILRQCYELDIAGLAVEIDTSDLAFTLSSATVAPAMHHIAKIDLFDREKRLGFFHISDGDGGFYEIPNVITKNNK